MAIPLTYNLRSLRVRWTSTVVAVLGIAGTVAVFIAMLAMANGFQKTLVSSGSPQNAIIMRAGSTSEMESAVSIDQLRVIEDAPGVERGPKGPLVSPEVVVIAAFPLKSSGTDANVQIRGVSNKALDVRSGTKIIKGRFFQPGLNELVVGKNALNSYSGFDIGSEIKFGGATWNVVGILDAGGSAFDSEIWADAEVIKQVYKRPLSVFQSVTARLTSPEALQGFKDALTADPRLTVQVEREISYYEKQSRGLTKLITVLGTLIAAIMGIGAVFGALNTMYSAVSERSREIATMRALGFSFAAVVLSFLFEAICIALIGGIIGALCALPINGVTTGTLNWQTFSHLAFAFRITPALMLTGVAFALLMGIIGGVPPAIRAARGQVAVALREL